jgi:hypothetical protein
MWKCDNAVVGEKLTHNESSVRGCIVIVEQPVAHVPQFRSFSPNALPQTTKNIAIELGVHGLAFRSKFKHALTYYHWLAFCGTRLKTFLYIYIYNAYVCTHTHVHTCLLLSPYTQMILI